MSRGKSCSHKYDSIELLTCVNNETGERLASRTLGVRVTPGQDEVEIGDAAVGDPHLLTVDDPLVSLLHRLRLDPGNVATGSRLSDP